MLLTERRLRIKIRSILREIFGIERPGTGAWRSALDQPVGIIADDWEEDDRSYDEITEPSREKAQRQLSRKSNIDAE